MKNEKTIKEQQKSALLSLLAILGIILVGLSYYCTPLLFLGVPISLIGGMNFGRLIKLTFPKDLK